MPYQKQSNETSSLLSESATDSSHGSPRSHKYVISNKRQRAAAPEPPSLRPIKATVAVLLAIVSIHLVYDIYVNFIRLDYPDRPEEQLVAHYKEVADSSIELLDDKTRSLGVEEAVPAGCEATVLMMRHCEDLGGGVRYKDGTKHCSYLGFQRSLYLARLFGNATEGPQVRWPLPSRLYGLWSSHPSNKRQYEFLRPLSDKSGVQIQMIDWDHKEEDLREAVYKLLSTGQLCHKVVVVIWKHKFIRELAAALGCDKERGCPGGEFDQFAWNDYEFDTVWELSFVYKPEALRAFPHNESIFNHGDGALVNGWKVLGTRTKQYFDPLEFKWAYYNGQSKYDNWMQHYEDMHHHGVEPQASSWGGRSYIHGNA